MCVYKRVYNTPRGFPPHLAIPSLSANLQFLLLLSSSIFKNHTIQTFLTGNLYQNTNLTTHPPNQTNQNQTMHFFSPTTLLYTLTLTSLIHCTPLSNPNPNALEKRALGLGAPCNERPRECSRGLVCIGPDNHLKCQCNRPKCYSYNAKRLSGLPACRSRSNPGGLGYTVVTKCGCGDALVPDVCGRGRASVTFVTRQGADVRCGSPC